MINNNIKTTLFVPLENIYDKNPVPIIMIDVSGSTGCQFKKHNCDSDDEAYTVKKHECKIARDIMIKNKYSKAHVIYWSSNAEIHENISPNDIEQLCENIRMAGTSLIPAIKLIKDTYFADDKLTQIYIITDGEICDDESKLANDLLRLSKYNVSINIIAVEPNGIV
jgi:hypothetical protein